MIKEHQDYIKENRLKESMMGMSKEIGVPYNQVRNYMIKNNLMLSKEQVLKIQVRKCKETKSKVRPWNWDALP